MTFEAVERPSLVGIDGREIAAGVNPAFDEERATKDWVFAELGDLDDVELFFNDILVAKYIRETVAKGLIAAEITRLEDNWQGVVGLVLKVGPRAFQDDDRNQFHGVSVKRGDWVLYRNTDGWDKSIARLGEASKRPIQCRLIQDAHIRARVRWPGRLMGNSE